MLRSDAETRPEDNLFHNIQSINLDVILKIQKDVDPYDTVSLVFLLYEVPDTALQKLIVYQTVSKDVETNNMNLLYDWALYASNKHQATWRYEFLEALTICRLYKVIRKLGFNVSNVKKHYLPENVHVNVYIDPMKKILYRICENMTMDNLTKLKQTLLSFKKDVSRYETAELIFLDLMCQKFITIGQYCKEKKVYTNTYDVEPLAEILENFSGLSKFAATLIEVQNQISRQDDVHQPQLNNAMLTGTEGYSKRCKDKLSFNNESFGDIYQLMEKASLENEPFVNLKTDTTRKQRDVYVINNKNRIGVCCIINQEKFYPSKDSIKTKVDLSDRLGSSIDLIALEKTMRGIKFVVKSKSNLNHVEVFEFIKDVVQNDIIPEDSVFMLCILSHGIKGHVYAADSVKIKVQDIQNYLDSNDCCNLHGMPKVLILQACQVEEQSDICQKIVADGPKSSVYLKKLHFLIYWATAPEYEAYRLEDKGSFFIQCLCAMIEQRAMKESLNDIFITVTNYVSRLCAELQHAQVPIFECSLNKKLYLHQI